MSDRNGISIRARDGFLRGAVWPPARGARAMAFVALAVGLGLTLGRAPWATAGFLALATVGACAFIAGRRRAHDVLLLYVAALVTLPVVPLRLGSLTIPLAPSDLLLPVVALALFAAPAPAGTPPDSQRLLGGLLVAVNAAYLLSLLFVPLLGLESGLAWSAMRFLRFAPTLLACAAVVRLAPGPEQVRRTLMVLALALSAQALVGIFLYAFQGSVGFAPDTNAEQYLYLNTGAWRLRAQGTVGESSSLAHLMGIGVLVSLCLLARGRGRAFGVFALTLCACSVCLLLTFSRGLLISLVLGVAAFGLAAGRARAPRLAVAVAGVLVVLAALSVLGVPWVESVGQRFLPSDLAGRNAALDAYLSGRLGLWQKIAAFLADNPLVLMFGIGFRALPHVAAAGTNLADNDYLRLLIETGLLGLGTTLALMFVCMREAWRSRGQGSAIVGPAGALLTGLWVMHASFMLVGDAMTFWRSLPVLFLLQFELPWAAPRGR